MIARYHLLPRGVYDRQNECAVLPGTPEWREYQAHLAVGNAVDPTPVEFVLADARRERCARVNIRRNNALAAGFTFAGHVFDSDPRSQAAITAAANAELPTGFSWRSKSNVDVPMDEEGMVGLAAAMVAHNHACHLYSRDLKAAIAASDDPASIDIDQGWP